MIINLMMQRKSARELIKRILVSITDSPKSISELAQDCGSNWESTKRYLESLKAAGAVQEREEGNKRIFSVSSHCVPRKAGNYFGLPIKPEDEERIGSLFFKIKEEWVGISGKPPGKTQVHKSLAKIDKMCGLKLPIGWYLFGPICAKPYDPLLAYDYAGLDAKTLGCVREVVKGYSTETSAGALKLRHYNEENKVLYQAKEMILALFSSSDFSKKNIKETNALLCALLKNLPPIPDEASKELVNEYAGIVLQLLNVLPEEDIQLVKNDVCQAFNEVWKLIALHGCFSDLEPYYAKNYSKEAELAHFDPEMSLQKFEVIEHLSHLSDLIPQEPEPQDEAYQKLKRLFSSIKELSPEEKKEKEKELEAIRGKKGEKGVQDFLSRKFGLD